MFTSPFRQLDLARFVFISFLAFMLIGLSGCSVSVPPLDRSSAGTALRGGIYGGQQPVKNALVQIYVVGASGDRLAAVPLLASPPLTNASGAFSLTNYTCPSSDALVYLVALGGDPGIGKSNPALALMAALGPCGGLNLLPYISVNEITTVASVFPLSGFMSSYANTGSGASDSAMLSSAFAAVNALVDIASGTAPGTAFAAGLTVPVVQIDTLADVIATCVNSAGGVAGDGTPCGTLFQDAAPSSGAPPMNTIDALINIAQNPGQHVAALFDLVSATPPFQPTLTAPPATWRVLTTPNVVERPNLLAEYLLNEGSGSLAHDTSGMGNDGTINGATWEGSADLNFGGLFDYIQMPAAVNTARTFQLAVYFPVFGNGSLPQAPGYGAPNQFAANDSLLCGTDASQLCLTSSSVNGSKAYRFWAFNTDSTEAAVPVSPGWHVFTLICGSNNGGPVVKTHYLYDGSEVSSYLRQGDAGTCPVPTGGTYQIGGSSLYYYSWFLGKIGAVWAWSTPLTLAEASTAATSALNYIHSKGVVTSFSNADSVSPQLIGGFDSRTYGANVSQPLQWMNAISVIDPTYTRLNLGIPGQLAYDACNQFELTYGEQIPPAPVSAITVLWGGVNDFLFSGQTPQQVANSLQCLVQKAKAAGSRVILATEIDFTDNNYYSLSGDANKNALNAIIRANALLWGADSIADLATDPHIGADGASTNTNCFVDGVHPGDTCEPYITTIMQNAVNELLGSTSPNPTHTTAASYQEQAGDDYLFLTGTAPQTISLPSCIGYSLPRTITNAGPGMASLAAIHGEVLTGSSMLDPGVTGIICKRVVWAVLMGGCQSYVST